ncbi:Fe-S cluster assembly protein SufD [Alkalicoccus chagannorensis]|uniref:Fe-S cluster assembly protein SufD n=1 Tax=Alkalicoccus chagannorensis TaxID=427072 RepID=UPI0004275093|nr:Fe-S cluster assembly protein SufD [Alkalicoccus chagannorensis]
MTTEVTFPVQQQELQSFSKDRREPQWFTDQRLKALDQAEHLELPNPDKTKITKWNFTSFTFDPETEATASYNELSDAVRTLVGEENKVENLITQKNGITTYAAAKAELKDKGVIFTDIQTALEEHSDLMEKYFMQAVTADENKLTAAHAAMVNGGVFIYVPAGVKVEAPLQAVYAHEGNFGLFNHVLMIVEDQAEATYIENYLSEGSGDQATVNIVAEVVLGREAKVNFGSVDNFADSVTTYVNRRGQVNGEDAELYWSLGMMNDGNTVSDNTTYLHGQGSHADTKSVSIGRGSQVQNFTTNVIHFGKDTDGQILKHGVMRDRATSIFNGISKIEKGATKANGEQTERVLMLSERARGDANPILLIDEDDVTAGHAASVGRIDPLQMFYLMSRGLSRLESERLIIHGFLEPVVGALAIDSVKEQLYDLIERKVY